MKAVLFDKPGGPEVLRIVEVPDLKPGPGQILIRVRATAVNRADLLQRRGRYPPPPGESEILGLELAGKVEALGPGVEGVAPRDRVFALVAGGGYAEKAVVDHRLALPIPSHWSFTEAAAVPEAFLTAQEVLFTAGALRAGEAVLIHAAGSGIGTAAVQMARQAGARVLATAGTERKIKTALELDAEAGCLYKERDFAAWVEDVTQKQGVDLIADPVGAAYWERNLRCLREGGRLVVYGLLGGGTVSADLWTLMSRRVSITGLVMRSRAPEEKAEIVRRFRMRWLPLLAAGVIRPVIDSVFPWDAVADAHRRMEANENVGKIVLEVP
jgi:putative PIG3 family NAD(P)H quinone oxidoreductase